MSSILDRRSTDITKEFGSGERVGEAEPWLSKDLVVLDVLLMVIVTDCIQLLFMQILWSNTLFLKSANYPYKECYFS